MIIEVEAIETPIGGELLADNYPKEGFYICRGWIYYCDKVNNSAFMVTDQINQLQEPKTTGITESLFLKALAIAGGNVEMLKLNKDPE